MTAAILGFFGSSWFGWALDDPPPSWRGGLVTGAIVSIATAVTGGVVAAMNWNEGTVFDRSTSVTFGIVVLVEVVLAGVGAFLLTRRERRELIAPWVALVVGIHFLPLAALLEVPVLYALGVVMSILSIVSVRVARSRSITISAVTGVFTGLSLLIAAWISLLTIWF